MTHKLFLGIPGAALYRLLRPETNQHLLHFADIPRSARIIAILRMLFSGSNKKEMNI
jgi:hypothetical protein